MDYPLVQAVELSHIILRQLKTACKKKQVAGSMRSVYLSSSSMLTDIPDLRPLNYLEIQQL